ncbi:MAG: hypothetical protein JRH20_09505 [Deltaproteobacteria bacterium]|nr:hypothetical protein [Deltaproteobacteria bacterium]
MHMPAKTVRGRTKPRIVIVGMERFGDEAWAEVERRTGAELSALGLDVLRVQGRVSGTDARLAELGTLAARQDAIAAVRIARRGDRRTVEVWIYDALTRKMVLRRVSLSASGSKGDLAALQVVELLHASLLEVRIARKAMLGRHIPELVEKLVARKLSVRDPKSPPSPLIVHAHSPPWHLSAGGAMLSLGDELDPVAGVGFALSYALTPTFHLGAEIMAPLLSSTLSDPRGEASVFGGTLRLVAIFEPWPRARVSPGVSLGLGGLLLRAAGQSAPGATDDVQWSAVPLAASRFQLSVRLMPTLRLVASAAMAVALPKVQVRFDDDRLATAGWPLLDAQLGVQWSWGR